MMEEEYNAGVEALAGEGDNLPAEASSPGVANAGVEALAGEGDNLPAEASSPGLGSIDHDVEKQIFQPIVFWLKLNSPPHSLNQSRLVPHVVK
jgi:hypothetical protein